MHGRGADHAVVGHDAGIVGEVVDAAEEIGIREIAGGSHRRSDVDHRAIAEHHACGIDKINAAVGKDRAVDHRGRAALDAIEHAAGRGRLDEIEDLAGADAEALIIDDGVGAVCADGGDAAGLRDHRGAGGDAADLDARIGLWPARGPGAGHAGGHGDEHRASQQSPHHLPRTAPQHHCHNSSRSPTSIADSIFVSSSLLATSNFTLIGER